jgi:hypothetical protein
MHVFLKNHEAIGKKNKKTEHKHKETNKKNTQIN